MVQLDQIRVGLNGNYSFFIGYTGHPAFHVLDEDASWKVSLAHMTIQQCIDGQVNSGYSWCGDVNEQVIQYIKDNVNNFPVMPEPVPW